MDELNNYLMNMYPDNYITGVKDCNLLIWGAKGTVEHTPKLCTLIVGYDYSPYSLTQDDAEDMLLKVKSQNPTFDRLYNYGYRFSTKVHIPLLIILYPSLRREFDNRWEESTKVYDEEKVMFYCKEVIQDNVYLVNGENLRLIIYDKLGQHYGDKGTSKEKNKKIADYFHMWSRDCLTKYITKFDLDGFIVSNSGGRDALIEIKRSSKPLIPEWYPIYDKPDYKLQQLFADTINADFWLLHHEKAECTNETNISFFKIKGISDNENDYFLKSSFRIMQLPLTGDNSFDSIVKHFINYGTIGDNYDYDETLYCPLCGGQLRVSNKTAGLFYCSNFCSMFVGKAMKTILTPKQIRSLLEGTAITIENDSSTETFLPDLVKTQYDKLFWKKKKV